MPNESKTGDRRQEVGTPAEETSRDLPRDRRPEEETDRPTVPIEE